MGSALFFGLFFSLAILGILSALVHYINHTKGPSSASLSGAIDYMIYNLQLDPIIGLTLVPPLTSCPVGSEPLTLGRWSGLVAGCDYRGLARGLCDSDGPGRDVKGFPGADLSIWGNAIWCITRAELDVDYVKNSKCPTGFKECSPSICMKDSLYCPITSVGITIAPVDSTSISFGTNQYYTITRELGKSPLVDIDISVNNIPCFSGNELPTGAGPYVLIKDVPKGCNTYGLDELFSFTIETIDQATVLVQNLIPNQVFEYDGYLSVLQNTNVVLAGRRRITQDSSDECVGLDYNQLKSPTDKNRFLRKTVSVASKVALGLHCLAMLIGIFVLCMKEIELGGLICCFFTMEVILFIVMTGLVATSYSDIDDTEEYFKAINAWNCLPVGQPHQLVQDYPIFVHGVAYILHKYALYILIVSLASFVPFVISLCYAIKY